MTVNKILGVLRRALSPWEIEALMMVCETDGVDIVTGQKLAGHASPVTTAKYDRRGEETKRNAVQKLRLRQE